MKRRALVALAAVLGVAAMGRAAHALYIFAKAEVAQELIRHAWAVSVSTGKPQRPWPWADTHPVARLGWPEQRVELFVLAGSSGRTLAFGPGHLSGTPSPGEHGNVAIAGHRDTHFAFLARLRQGDRLLLEGPGGEPIDYVVDATTIVDRNDAAVLDDHGDDRLTLVTCYPFDAVTPGGPQRFVVTALRDREAPRSTS